MRSSAGLALLGLFVLVAGCSDPGPAAPAPSSSAASSSGPAAALGNATPELVLEQTIFSWDGHTKEGAWVCSDQTGMSQCQAGQQVAPDGEHVTSLPYVGTLVGVAVNLTWQAAPGQAGLVLAAYGNTTSGLAPLAFAHGPSPLALAVARDALATIVPDGVVVLMVWPEGKTATQPSVFVDATQQPFHAEGTLTVERAA